LPADLEQRFTALMKAEGAALARLAASYALGSADRDDLFQDIAAAIWRALPRFRGECSERTFVFRIAHNRGIAHIARRRPSTIELAEDLDLRDPRPDPEQSLSVEQQRQRLLDAVLKLPIGYRQVVTLALEGMSYAEIGEILGIAESNAGARLTRARQLLRAELKGASHGA
jgi:RNA polymerase sigma-70 factor (ECF subfamily)